MQDYNFVCGSVWMQNLVSDIKGTIYDWGCLRTRYWGEYLDWREEGTQMEEEKYAYKILVEDPEGKNH
jgi:hypothetical protein